MWLDSDILVLDTSAREDTVMYICILCELDENALLVFYSGFRSRVGGTS